MTAPEQIAAGIGPESERRAWVRGECGLVVLIVTEAAGRALCAQARDLSEGGLGVRVPPGLALGTECRVKIELPGGGTLSDLPARVAWSQASAADGQEEADLAGLAFGALSAEARSALSALVHRHALETIRRLRAGTEGLQRVSRLLDSFTDLHELLERIMDEAKLLTAAEASSLMLWDAEREELFFEVALGERGEAVRALRLRLGEGVAGSAALTREPVNVADVSRDRRWFAEADAVSGFRTRSILAVPMLRRGRLVGVLEVLNRWGAGGFTSADEANLSVLAGEAAIVIENARLHQEKVRAERLAAVGQAVAELAHCMKNILNGIQGGAYVLDLGLAKDDHKKLHTGWDMVKRNTTFLSNLVLDMLAYAKDREPHYEDTDVNDLLRTVADLISGEAARRGVQVKAEPDGGIPAVRVDPTAIYRVLLNLGTNAVEACGEGEGRVWLRSQQAEAGWFTLEVEDNGCGIPPEHRGHLFTEFFSTKGAKGTGLGLAVAGKIVREHGGRIEVDSEVGRGTRFEIWLPTAGKKHRVQGQARKEER